MKGKNGSNKHLTKNNKKARVFISYPYVDRDQMALMRLHRKNGNLELIDYSVKQLYESRWKSGVRYRIKTSDAFQLNISSNSFKSKSMKWEYKEAKRRNKPIYGVITDKGAKIPDYMIRDGCPVVDWNCKRIQKVLNSLVDENKSNTKSKRSRKRI